MRFERFIAERLYFTQQTSGASTRPAVRVALAGLIIGVMVMIVTVCVVVGFKQTVTDKVVGFAAHLRIVNFENNNTFELSPIAVSDSMLQSLAALPHIESVNTFVTKPGIIKTDEAFQGIVFKGTTYWDYFADNLIDGRLPEAENEIVLSRKLCDLMNLHIGDAVMSYFVGESVKVRKFIIIGIYRTGFTEFDERFILGKMNVVRRLNGWSDNQVSGVELRVDNLRNLY